MPAPNLSAHRSIRKYKPDPIPEETLLRIVEAASQASTSGNMQAYSIIATQDAAIKRALLPFHFGQSMATEAPVLLTFCADFHRMRRWMKLREAPDNFDNLMSFLIASIDAILASQNAALAAEAEGLGICYMGTTLASCFEIAKILRCPQGVVPVVGFSLGVPDENPPARPRLPLQAILHRETYQARSDDEILGLYAEKEISGWNRYLQDPALREACEREGARNLAQVYTKVKYTRESHEAYSANVLRCLKAQGFFEPGGQN